MTTPPLQLFNVIDGESIAARDGARVEVTSPVDDAVIATVPDSAADDVDVAVEAAARAFESWSRTTPRERSEALFRLADALEAEVDTFAELEALDAGNPLHVVRPEEMSTPSTPSASSPGRPDALRARLPASTFAVALP
jgi:betaine-aldehyde dehydrogenase